MGRGTFHILLHVLCEMMMMMMIMMVMMIMMMMVMVEKDKV